MYHQVYMRRNKPGGRVIRRATRSPFTIWMNEDDAESREKPSEVFKWYFGPEHGVVLPPRSRYGYRPLDLSDDVEESMSSSRIFPVFAWPPRATIGL